METTQSNQSIQSNTSSGHYEISEAIQSLQTALLAMNPEMPFILRKIHAQLKADPELATLLDEDEIGIIVNGLSTHTKSVIATTVAKSKTKSIKSIGVADL